MSQGHKVTVTAEHFTQLLRQFVCQLVTASWLAVNGRVSIELLDIIDSTTVLAQRSVCGR